jgi:hypothetical protein
MNARLLFCLSALSWSLAANAQDHFPSWLSGTWQVGQGVQQRFESWQPEHDSLLYGRSYRVNGKDTIVAETIVLSRRNARLWYIPTVAGQNKGQAVPFGSTTVTARQLVFVNPAHDFPQQITYTRIGNDSLLAEISGTLKGQPRRVQFPMKRVP